MIKRCSDCNQIIMGDDFICPKCGSRNIVMVKDDDRKKEDEDLSFRIERVPVGGYETINEDMRGLKFFIIFGIFIFLFGFIFMSGPLFLFIVELNKEENDIIFHLPFILFGSIAVITGTSLVIVCGKKKSTLSHLSKNGVVLKNIPFTVIKGSRLLKVKIEYKDEYGNNHVFKGLLPSYMLISKDICDVFVDPNNYKKYFVRYNIT